MLNRREFMGAGALALTTPSVTAQSSAPGPSLAQESRLPLSSSDILAAGPPADLDRAREILRAQGVDGLVVRDPVNVYYLTGYRPITSLMSPGPGDVYAILPAREGQPVAVVTSEFTYYYLLSDLDFDHGAAVFIYQPDYSSRGEKQPKPGPSAQFADRGVNPLTAMEQGRRERLQREKSRWPVAATSQLALDRALREVGLQKGLLAVDSLRTSTALATSKSKLETVDGAEMLARMRVVKSPREVALHRIAAQANVEAAMEAVQGARSGASLREIRASFFAAAAKRANRGVFMVLDNISSEAIDDPLRDGQTFMFDAVSEGAGYHGDFARSVFVGEPGRAMQSAIQAMEIGWNAIRESLRPGLRLSEIPQIGRAAVSKAGLSFRIPFAPHSVGLYHSDSRILGDLELRENMVISVDCPLMEVGVGGTAHLEDLTLITRDGGVPLHETPPTTLTV